MSGHLTILVHGDAGTGKSWLGDSAPPPKLILDSEGRAGYLPRGPKVGWDVNTGPPPMPDGSWETCIANVLDFQAMATAFQWLRSGQHGFRSVVVDSLMEIQMRLIDKVAGLQQLETQDWGEVLRQLENLVRSYRDLVLLPGTVDCVVFTCGTREIEGKKQPLLQGQIRDKLPYFLDVVGYMYPAYAPDGTLVRQMLVNPAPNIVAKDNTNRLPGPVIGEPDLSVLFNYLNGGAAQ